VAVKCTAVELGAWDRQTDKLQHRNLHPNPNPNPNSNSFTSAVAPPALWDEVPEPREQ